MNQTHIDTQYQQPYEEIIENSNHTGDNDMYIWIKYTNNTKKKQLDSTILSRNEVQKIYEQQQEAIKQMEIMKHDQKVMDAMSAKSGYID